MEAGGAGDERGGVGGGQSLVAPSALWGIRGCVLNADALGCSEAVRPSVSFLLGPTLTYPPRQEPLPSCPPHPLSYSSWTCRVVFNSAFSLTACSHPLLEVSQIHPFLSSPGPLLWAKVRVGDPPL